MRHLKDNLYTLFIIACIVIAISVAVMKYNAVAEVCAAQTAVSQDACILALYR